MQAVCTDGTIIECDRFRAIDDGVLLFDEESGEADEEKSEEATGFIPLQSLRFVLPDSVDYRTNSGVGRAGPQGQYDAPPQRGPVQQSPDRPPQQQPHPR